MEKEFDFSKAVKNPYAGKLDKEVTITVSPSVIDYFKAQAEKVGIPYQTLISLYLSDCMNNKRELQMKWQ